MNTGHEGSMTTVHANSARDALARIENMVLMAGLDLPMRAIREQMASALHLLVHLSRSGEGRRQVVSVTEVAAMEGDVVALRETYRRGVECAEAPQELARNGDANGQSQVTKR
jgi:pilus assembly protein CpaF